MIEDIKRILDIARDEGIEVRYDTRIYANHPSGKVGWYWEPAPSDRRVFFYIKEWGEDIPESYVKTVTEIIDRLKATDYFLSPYKNKYGHYGIWGHQKNPDSIHQRTLTDQEFKSLFTKDSVLEHLQMFNEFAKTDRLAQINQILTIAKDEGYRAEVDQKWNFYVTDVTTVTIGYSEWAVDWQRLEQQDKDRGENNEAFLSMCKDINARLANEFTIDSTILTVIHKVTFERGRGTVVNRETKVVTLREYEAGKTKDLKDVVIQSCDIHLNQV